MAKRKRFENMTKGEMVNHVEKLEREIRAKEAQEEELRYNLHQLQQTSASALRDLNADHKTELAQVNRDHKRETGALNTRIYVAMKKAEEATNKAHRLYGWVDRVREVEHGIPDNHTGTAGVPRHDYAHRNPETGEVFMGERKTAESRGPFHPEFKDFMD